jgi:hypothetical protein
LGHLDGEERRRDSPNALRSGFAHKVIGTTSVVFALARDGSSLPGRVTELVPEFGRRSR